MLETLSFFPLPVPERCCELVMSHFRLNFVVCVCSTVGFGACSLSHASLYLAACMVRLSSSDQGSHSFHYCVVSDFVFLKWFVYICSAMFSDSPS